MPSARSVVFVLLLLTVPSAAFAQVTTADIVGRVTDTSAAVLPGVTVTIENTGTGDVRSAVTGETGDYVFNLLPIGTYTVRIELAGFQTQSGKVTLSTGDRARLDAKLQLGQLEETLTVTAEAPLVQTDTSTVGALVTEQVVQNAPAAGRNFVRLIQALPGANEGAPNALASGTRPDDRRQSSAISINGANDNQNNQLIDGIDNNERAIGTIGVKPSIDAIAEIKVQTNLYTAEAGRTAGGVVNVITKSGTNEFHGSAFEFWRNDRFDSKNFFETTKPELKQHQFGGSVGGPLLRDRTFFFGDIEGLNARNGVTNVLTVPTMRMRRGDFSELAAAIYDPANGRARFLDNVIPADRLNPIALRYMAIYPEPTAAGLANNYASTTMRTQDGITGDFRIDHKFSANDLLFARYSYNTLDTYTPGGCPPTADGIEPGCHLGQNLGFPGPNVTKAHGVHVSDVHVFNPSLIGEVKVGYLKTDINSLPANYQTNLSSAFGLVNVNGDDITSGLSLVNPAGYALLGDQTNVPLINHNQTYQVSGSLTKTRGAHNIKMGAGLITRQFGVIQSGSPVGVFSFDASLTNSGVGGTGGNTIASFLLGYPSQVVRQHALIDQHINVKEPNVYVQDDWRATSWLTLNLGVRYDVFTPFNETDGHIANLDLSTFRMLIPGQDGVSDTAGVKTDYGNVAPRFGLSATLPGELVLRGGYGLSYFPGNIASFAYMKNAPFVANYGPVISAGTAGGVPTVLLSSGLPPIVANDPSPSALVGQIRAVDVNFKSTRVQQFNAIVEKDFGGNAVSAGYVGSRGDRVALNPNINLAPVAAGAVQARRRFAPSLPGVADITLFQSIYETSYDALQLVFQRRYLAGLAFNTNYTLAHNVATSQAPWDPFLIERADANLDVRHRWVMTVNYELPFGRSRTGLAGAVLGGWQVNAVAFWQSGLPFNVANAAARTNTGGTDRPNMVGDPELAESERTLQRWFNTAAFQAQPQFTAGDTPLNVMHGPSQRRLDMSLFKDFRMRDNWRMQVRAEVYNVTNTASFANPNSTFGSPAFGTISSTGNAIPRQMLFAAKLLF